jgi:hypothetical protein
VELLEILQIFVFGKNASNPFVVQIFIRLPGNKKLKSKGLELLRYLESK